MATKSTAATAENPLADIMGIEDEVPARSRVGRSSVELDLIKAELKNSVKDGKARSFKNVEKDDREVWARKVRSAGKSLNVDVETIYVPGSLKLFWGPKDVIKDLRESSNNINA